MVWNSCVFPKARQYQQPRRLSRACSTFFRVGLNTIRILLSSVVLHYDECLVPAGKPITRFPQAPHAAWHPSIKTSFFTAESSLVRYSCWCRREPCFPLLPLILCTLSALSSFSPAVLPLLLQVVLRPTLLVQVFLNLAVCHLLSTLR